MPKTPSNILNPMREAFCLAYVQNGGNARQACITAGYAITSSHIQCTKIMKDPLVRARIEVLSARQSKAVVAHAQASRQWVVGKLVEEAERAERASERIAALKLVGDSLGLFVTRTMQIESPLDGLSADQLAALLRLAEDLQAAAGHELTAKAKPGARQGAERVIEHDPTAVSSRHPSRDEDHDEEV